MSHIFHTFRKAKMTKYKLMCPRGTQTCALAVANIKVNGNGKVILSWIRIRNPISTKIKLVLEVHPLLPPTKFGGDP